MVSVLALCPMLVGGGSGADGLGLAGPLGDSGSSGVVGIGYEGLDSSPTAPVWPFRGVMNYMSFRVVDEDVVGQPSWRYWNPNSGEWERDFLQFWDVESEALHEVPLGPTIEGCPSEPLGYDGYVELMTYNWNGTLAVLRLPWGDDAYPHFVRTEVVSKPHGGFGPFLDGDLRLSYSGERLRVATAAGEAFYVARSPYAHPSGAPEEGSGGVGLFLSDAGLDDAPLVDEGMWDPVAEFDGSDGRHYGLSVIYAEPACTAEDSYVVAGNTGEVVACGWRYGGGPRLVEPEGSPPRPGVLALPQATTGIDCDEPLDLRDLATHYGEPAVVSEAARSATISGSTSDPEGSARGVAEVW